MLTLSGTELTELYGEGLTLAALADLTGMSAESVRRSLLRQGVELRPRGRQPGTDLSRGGRIQDSDGYVLLRHPAHPSANSAGYVREHRLVMEAALGRYLSADEVVAHRNGVADDNRLSNLILFRDSSDAASSLLKDNGRARGDIDNPKRSYRRTRSANQILRELAALQGELGRPIRRADLKPPHPSYRSVARAFGTWREGVAQALARGAAPARPFQGNGGAVYISTVASHTSDTAA